MAIAVVQSVGYTESGAAGTSHQKTGITTTATNVLVVAVGSSSSTAGSVSSVTDSAGNAYRLMCAGASGTNSSCEIWATTSASPAAISSGSVTVTTSTALGIAFRMYELSGTAKPVTGSIVSAVSNVSGTGTAVTLGGGTGTSLWTDDLAFSATATDGASTNSSSAFTAGAATATNSDSSTTTSNNVQLLTAYRLMTATTVQNYSVTLGTSRHWISIFVRFTASGHIDTLTIMDVAATAMTLSCAAKQVRGINVFPTVVPGVDAIQFIPPPSVINRP